MPSEPVSLKVCEARASMSYQSEASSSVGTVIRVDFQRLGFGDKSGESAPMFEASLQAARVLVHDIFDSSGVSCNEAPLSVPGGRSLWSTLSMTRSAEAHEMNAIIKSTEPGLMSHGVSTLDFGTRVLDTLPRKARRIRYSSSVPMA